jgi:hypothetical protein
MEKNTKGMRGRAQNKAKCNRRHRMGGSGVEICVPLCGKQTNPLMRMVNEIDEGNKGGTLRAKEMGRGAL